MREVSIQDYIGFEKPLTAEEVRQLPVGSTVKKHTFDRRGTHQWRNMKVVQSGKRKMLKYYVGPFEHMEMEPIRATSDRMCYTISDDDLPFC